MAVVVVLVVGEVGNGRAGPLMLQKRGSRLRPTHLGRPCCPIFVVLFSTFWDNWSRCRGVYGVLMQFERVFSTSMTIWSRSKFFSADAHISQDWPEWPSINIKTMSWNRSGLWMETFCKNGLGKKKSYCSHQSKPDSSLSHISRISDTGVTQ